MPLYDREDQPRREAWAVRRLVEHRPVADEEVHLLLFEPASTLNTGNVRDERTRERLERL